MGALEVRRVTLGQPGPLMGRCHQGSFGPRCLFACFPGKSSRRCQRPFSCQSFWRVARPSRQCPSRQPEALWQAAAADSGRCSEGGRGVAMGRSIATLVSIT